MTYNPLTDFIALLRTTGNGVRSEQMPGLDYVVAALQRAGLISVVVGQTAPTSNQANTVWFRPNLPSTTAEGVVFLWNAGLAVYQAATPALWSALISGPFVSLIPSPGTAAPLMDGNASVGISLLYARQDHVHPSDTSRAPLASPALTGTPTAPTGTLGDTSTQIATNAFVIANGGLPPPIGSVLPYAGSSAPNSSWAFATGQAFSRTGVTAALFAALGITFGSGDGTTTFNGPDLRGRVVAGVDAGANRLTTTTMSSQSLGGIGGLETAVLLATQVPSITSTVATTVTGNEYLVASTGTGFGLTTFSANAGSQVWQAFSTGASISQTATLSGTGSATSNNTGTNSVARVQPTIELNYIIRVS